jgi:hypothetical protein
LFINLCIQRNINLASLNKKILFLFILIFIFNLSLFYFNFKGTELEFFKSDPLELQKLFGGGDRRYFIEAGFDLAAFNKVRNEFFWIYQLWPPGMSILNGLIFKFTQVSLFTFVHSVLASALLSYFFINVVQFAKIIRVKIGSLIFILTFYLTSFSRNWFFTDLMFYSDLIGTMLVLIAICKILIYLKSDRAIIKSLSMGFSIGMIIFAAAFMRSPYIVIIQLITVTYLIAIVLESVRLLTLGVRRYKLRKIQLSNLIFLTTIIVTASQFSNIWIDFREKNMPIGNADWSVAQSRSFISPWVPQKQLPSLARSGGAGWACEIDKIKCEFFSIREGVNEESYSGLSVTNEEYRKETLRVILNNPITYLQNRFDIFQKVYTSKAGLSTENPKSMSEAIISFILLFLFIFYSLFQFKKDYTYVTIHVVMLSLLAPYFIFHLEPRYFFVLNQLSLFGIFPLLLLLRILVSKARRKIDINYF